MASLHTNMTSTSRIKNFRPAAGLGGRVYRCAAPDKLAALFRKDGEITTSYSLNSPEHVILHRAGLVLDLRSAKERDESKAQIWITRAPGGEFRVQEYDKDDEKSCNFSDSIHGFRTVYRVDVLSPQRLSDYISRNWISPLQEERSTSHYAIKGNKAQQLHLDILNKRGLSGLYEAIINTSQKELFFSLKIITKYFESLNNSQTRIKHKGIVVVHCVQGKDRTGLLIMLCQSIVGLSDEEIIDDYHKSDSIRIKRRNNEGQNRISKFRSNNNEWKFNANIFAGAPTDIMKSTLETIRLKYGSISPGYLDHIGFHSKWRERFLASVSHRDQIETPLSRI